MVVSVFTFNDYRAYLTSYIASLPGAGRGFRSVLANKIGCQRTFISQVLRGDVHFNLEHAEAVSQAIGHTTDEEDYFLTLVLYARAGTQSLKKKFLKQIEQVRAQRKILKNRFKEQETLSVADMITYYSSWQFGAVRVLTTIPEFQTKAAIQGRLKISPDRLSHVLDFLVTRGLLTEKKGAYQTTQKSMFLGNDSPLISKHHMNWRNQALQSLDYERGEDLHFSAVSTLSRADIVKVRELISNTLETFRKTAQASNEEVIYSFCVDFFEL